MMDCRTTRSLFSAKTDGELDIRQEKDFLSHIHHCPACREEWEDFRKTLDLLAELRESPLPSGIMAGVRSKLATHPHPSWWKRLLAPMDFTLPFPAAAALVVVAMAAAVVFKSSFVPYHSADRSAAPAISGQLASRQGSPPPAVKWAHTGGRQTLSPMPAHPPLPAGRLDRHPDVLITLLGRDLDRDLLNAIATLSPGAKPKVLNDLVLVELPSGDLAGLRRILTGIPYAIAPHEARSPHFGQGRNHLLVAITRR